MDAIATGENNAPLHEQQSQMKVTDLIDDCLIDIFSLLDIKDLVNVVQVNIRFRDIGRSVFSKNNKWIDILSAFEETKNAQNAFTMTKNLLERFGDVIVGTGFDYTVVKKKAMRKNVHDLIIKHCSDTLEEINFLGINDSLKFTKPFPNVKSLYFYDGGFHHSMSEISTFFPNVEKISLNNVEGLSWHWGFNNQHIPSLQSFDNGYDASHYAPKPDMGWYLDVIHINRFIASNLQLHKLSTSLNSHKCSNFWLAHILEQNFTEYTVNENEGRVYDHPMSFKITVQSCAPDCEVVYRLVVPYERVESLELCLKGLNASEFITKCGNIEKLKLYLRFDSHLFDASYFKKIASALSLLKLLVIHFETKQKNDLFAQFMDFPPAETKEVYYEKGTIHRTIHPFISQCKQLEKIEYIHRFESRKTDDSKKFIKLITEDMNDFEKTIRHEQLKWTSNNKEVGNFGSIGYIYKLTKQEEHSLQGK